MSMLSDMDHISPIYSVSLSRNAGVDQNIRVKRFQEVPRGTTTYVPSQVFVKVAFDRTAAVTLDSRQIQDTTLFFDCTDLLCVERYHPPKIERPLELLGDHLSSASTFFHDGSRNSTAVQTPGTEITGVGFGSHPRRTSDQW